MWAAGGGESIAVSSDAGEHWQYKHKDPKGALLLELRFVDRKFGYAAGTGGTVLFTEDGGETWTTQKLTDEAILQASFGDPQHGVIRTTSALLSTVNGGQTWQPVVPAADPDWLKKFPVTAAMVALDKNWMTVRVARTASSANVGEFLWSGDGGQTWNTSSIDNTRIYDLFVARGAIWAAGYEGAVPMSFRQVDGTKWEHVPVNFEACHWPGCGGYTPQGYFAGTDFVLLNENGRETLATFPRREVLTNQWAQTDNQLCVISSRSIECTTLQPTKTVKMNRDMPSWEQAGFAGIGKIPKTNPQCIRCELQGLYFAKTASAGPLDLRISFAIEPSGGVSDTQVTGDVPDEVRSKILQEAQAWLFEPFHKNGEPTAVNVNMHVRIALANRDLIRVTGRKNTPPPAPTSPK